MLLYTPIFYVSFCANTAEFSSWDTYYMVQNVKIFIVWPFAENFCQCLLYTIEKWTFAFSKSCIVITTHTPKGALVFSSVVTKCVLFPVLIFHNLMLF